MSDVSTRDLRNRFRDQEREAGRLRLLELSAHCLAKASDIKRGLGEVLELAIRHMAGDSGLILSLDQDKLTVVAAHGNVLPVGASILPGGVLASVLQAPHLPLLREHIESRLRLGDAAKVALELMCPLRMANAAVGLLVMISDAHTMKPTDEEMVTISALGVLIAGALQRSTPTKARVSRRAAAAAMTRLTPREQQVFALLPRGLSNAEIADQLGMATGTAKIHVERILHKLGVSDRTQAAVRAVEWGYK